MSPFEIASLSSIARWSVTFTTLTLILVSGRALARSARAEPSQAPRQRAAAGPLPWLLGAFAVAAAFAHVPALTATLPRLFPVGIALGLVAAAGSLFVPAARRAFAAVSDGDMRLMLAYRAIYGGLLFGLAGVGVMPPAFALSAGLGDLVVGWLALAAPRSIDAAGPRGWRLLVHGLGLLDLLQVMALAALVVRPWSALHHNATDVMTLPWVAVPLMLALNLHGFWQGCTARATESGSHGLEPARGLRSAVPRA